ncbi:hypothetical protein COHA_000640 [Chlorella ohadii]|uniref:Uncharacterized protein n=1 Tax=Chlorella ohadii TaxID=2649997 RepID=A0AAD5E097_9CHLO|nr:hypothetical protein COHA_000640 [Chlorella ohadii]
MTPMGADSGAHSSAEASSSQQQSHSQPPHRSLSVHWAEALEQHSQRPHTPLHALCAPDKPCLKPQQTAFPYLEEAAQLEGLMRRPRAMLAALQLDGGGGAPLQVHQPAAAKKRSRMAAFGQ